MRRKVLCVFGVKVPFNMQIVVIIFLFLIFVIIFTILINHKNEDEIVHHIHHWCSLSTLLFPASGYQAILFFITTGWDCASPSLLSG